MKLCHWYIKEGINMVNAYSLYILIGVIKYTNITLTYQHYTFDHYNYDLEKTTLIRT